MMIALIVTFAILLGKPLFVALLGAWRLAGSSGDMINHSGVPMRNTNLVTNHQERLGSTRSAGRQRTIFLPSLSTIDQYNQTKFH